MDAVLMCGGRGTRLDRGEKPLLEIAGVPMVDRVRDALEASRVEAVHAVTSPHVPETTAHLTDAVHRTDAVHPADTAHLAEDDRLTVHETAGEGYVEDLTTALELVERPVLTVVSDLPLLSADLVDRTLEVHRGGNLTVCVPTALKDALGVSADTTRAHGGRELSPTGLNVVGAEDGSETLHVSYDARLAVNVNRPADAQVAEVLADGP